MRKNIYCYTCGQDLKSEDMHLIMNSRGGRWMCGEHYQEYKQSDVGKYSQEIPITNTMK